MSGQVRRQDDGAVRILTLDRPERRNRTVKALTAIFTGRDG